MSPGTSYLFPLVGGGASGLSYVVQSSDPTDFAATMLTLNDRVLTLDVSHASSGAGDPAFSGAMTFQLFDQVAPNTVTRIANFVNTGGYRT